MLEKLEEHFTKYEIARILGARALQVAMDAPLLLKIDEKELEDIHYNPIEIAKREFVAGVLPITVNRPLPKKREGKIKVAPKESPEILKKKKEEKKEKEELKTEKKIEEKTGKEVIHAKEAKEDEKLEMEEEAEEKKVVEDAEIMELATPEDEGEAAETSSEEEY